MNRTETGHTEFEQMLHRSQGILFKVCLAFTDRQHESVENLYQEIVLNLWRGWDKFRGESDEKTWVYRVAFNTAATEFRKTKREGRDRFVALDENIVDTIAEETDPMRELLYELIDLLDDGDKEMLLLHLDYNSYAKMACIIGCSESTVKHRMTSIKEKMVELKQKYYEM